MRRHAASLAVMGFVFAVVWWMRSLGYERLQAWLGQFGLLAPCVSAVCYSALVVVPGLSSDSFSMINGALFGSALGVPVSWSGMMLGTVFSYGIGHRVGRMAWLQRRMEQLPRRASRWGVSSIPFLVFVRYLPAIGGTVVNYSAGAFGVPFPRFLWTAAVSTLPPAVFWTLLGALTRG